MSETLTDLNTEIIRDVLRALKELSSFHHPGCNVIGMGIRIGTSPPYCNCGVENVRNLISKAESRLTEGCAK